MYHFTEIWSLILSATNEIRWSEKPVDYLIREAECVLVAGVLLSSYSCTLPSLELLFCAIIFFF